MALFFLLLAYLGPHPNATEVNKGVSVGLSLPAKHAVCRAQSRRNFFFLSWTTQRIP